MGLHQAGSGSDAMWRWRKLGDPRPAPGQPDADRRVGPEMLDAGRAATQALRGARILIVDDEPTNIQVLTRILTGAGYVGIASTTDPRQASALFQSHCPDLVVLDLHMPALDGFGVLNALRPLIPAETYLPIVMITGDDRTEVRLHALSAGVRDFLLKPFDIVEVLLRIRNQLETRLLHQALREQNQNLERMVLARTHALEESQVEVLERLASAAEFRDDDTGRHTQRVAALAESLARALGLEERDCRLIRRAAPLHDVGKVGIPDQVLLKPGRLTEEEFSLMRTHTIIGAKILGGGQSDLIQLAERIALSHHERWDGAGYPQGLAGPAIPQEARIVAVADFYDALSHERPYRGAWPVEKIRSEMADLRGRHFDPAMVDTFLGLEVS